VSPGAEPHVDLLVLGAGPAGAATAMELARSGLTVLIVDASAGRGDKIGESLPPSVGPLLDRLGLREALLATQPLACYGNRSSWGGDGGLVEHDFIRDPLGHGWRVDRRRFDAALIEAACAAGATYRCRTRMVDAVVAEGAGWRLRLAGPRGATQLTAGFVVDASGRASAFGRRQGARRCRSDRLVAVVAFLVPEGPPASDAATLVEAARDGWWYSGLLPDGRLATAFVSEPDLLLLHDIRTVDGWQTLVGATEHTQARIGEHDYRLVAPPRLVAADSALLSPVAGEGWLAVGDAAASFDPLSSHGIGAALWSGEQAAGALRRFLTGDAAALTVYAETVARSYGSYLWMQHAYYQAEVRWHDALFWRRRRESWPPEEQYPAPPVMEPVT